ncbi:transposase, Mutator family protein [Glaesserella parasuis 12939]|nr:transposase, Mutator family protein [Glaesserella parasuis 12939]
MERLQSRHRRFKAGLSSPEEVQARENLTALSQKWQAKYPLVAKGWEDNWANIATFFDYPADIRKAILYHECRGIA